MTQATLISPVEIAYLVTWVCFIVGLRYLSSPKTARIGNRISMAGMVIAIAATLTQGISGWWIVAVGLVVSASIGIYSARIVKMTAMPQMVALFNGSGGGAAALVATADILRILRDSPDGTVSPADAVPIVLSSAIGAISFAGSIIAFLKLQGIMTGRPIQFPGQQIVNGIVALVVIAGS
ncbi:MAG: NAD(P)(+) transhydrogenase (Re/Si-specific) subunit beta, partial [Candidatus Eremiobacteraeota bacterium]|nr:NAD(P)(+) transhydrogenase (Re/Si-specific) subunit beta [Candidatus Eremiobacteraeota bacterium]